MLIASNKKKEIIEKCNNLIQKFDIINVHCIQSNCTVIIDTNVFEKPSMFNGNLPQLQNVELALYKQENKELKTQHIDNLKYLPQELIQESNNPWYLNNLIHVTHFSISSIIVIILIATFIEIFKYRMIIYERIFKKKKTVVTSAQELQTLYPKLNEDIQS